MTNKDKINACLDEIELTQAILYKKLTPERIKLECRGWILKQKTLLKKLGFKGKMPRKKRDTKELA